MHSIYDLCVWHDLDPRGKVEICAVSNRPFSLLCEKKTKYYYFYYLAVGCVLAYVISCTLYSNVTVENYFILLSSFCFTYDFIIIIFCSLKCKWSFIEQLSWIMVVSWSEGWVFNVLFLIIITMIYTSARG